MPSPFPGMDPYLEAHWGDVHTRLIVYSGDQIRPQLPRELKVRVEEVIGVQGPEEEVRDVFVPDLRVVERQGPVTWAVGSGGAAAVAEPVLVPRTVEPATERSLQIIDSRSGNRLVTTIEILSPSNKLDPEGRSAFRRQQRRLELGDVNLVEIDLLREGGYVLSAPRELVPPSCLGPYRVCVIRAMHRERAEMYPCSLRSRLPTIRIPLRPDDADVTLDLQTLINAAYENGGYEDTDYRQNPRPALEPAEAQWALQWLQQTGRL